MRRLAFPILLLLLSPSLGAHAQAERSRWYAEFGGGLATSLDDPATAPGGGPFVGGLVGRRLGRHVTLGLSLGWHRSVNGTGTPFEATCPPPESPGPGCVRRLDARKDALEVAWALRIAPPAGAWRPHLTATLGAYRFREDRTFVTLDRAGEQELDRSPADVPSYAGAGGSVGLGLSHSPGGSPWSIVGSVRLHGVLTSPNGEWGSSSWVVFGVGVGRRF